MDITVILLKWSSDTGLCSRLSLRCISLLQIGSPSRVIDLTLNCIISSYVEEQTE